MTSHLPTQQGNQDLIGLQIIGESVFEKEKKYAEDLIAALEDGDGLNLKSYSQSFKMKNQRKLFWYQAGDCPFDGENDINEKRASKPPIE